MLSLIKQFNWIDILFLILLIRTSYIGIKRGLVVEFFKNLGVILSIFLSGHYYTKWGDFVHKKSRLALEFANFISFIALVIIAYLFFLVLRSIFLWLIKVEPVSFVNRWGGMILGISRGLLTVSLLISILYLSTIKYLEVSSKKSFSANYFSKISPKTYKFLFENLFVKFFPSEKLNEEILKVLE